MPKSKGVGVGRAGVEGVHAMPMSHGAGSSPELKQKRGQGLHHATGAARGRRRQSQAQGKRGGRTEGVAPG